MSEQTVDLRPSKQTKGQFLDDVDFEIVDAKAVMFQYPGTDTITPAAEISFMVEGFDKPRVEHYTAGRVRPSEDGNGFVGVDGKTPAGINEQTKLGRFLALAVTPGGLPEEELSKGLRGLIGVKGHGKQTEFKGGKNSKDDATIFAPTKIFSWGGKSSGGASGGAAESADDLQATVVGTILEALGSGPVPKAKLPSILKPLNNPKAVALALSEKFLKGALTEAGVTYADGKLSL